MRTPWLGSVLVACTATFVHADLPSTTISASGSELAPEQPAKRPAPAPDLGVLDPANLRSLTHDPVLGKADRVDGDEATGVVAFTFDDGPNPETTPAVIDALEKYDVPATFFIVTRRLDGQARRDAAARSSTA